ncbi:MAG: GNAT family N-acetyltransferase [Clostridiales bacterium]|nr:GNAT family N-acetyltransferase [Clostridiales bacterium]
MKIRQLYPEETGILKEFLYEAIFIPEGVDPPPKDIIEKPELTVYTDDFGEHKGDHALAAIEDGKIIGVVWTRIMDDYGHVDDETPSFAISLYKEYRGRGIGSELMRRMLGVLRSEGYKQASLAVNKQNYAVRMYEKSGFKTVSQNDEEYIMICNL